MCAFSRSTENRLRAVFSSFQFRKARTATNEIGFLRFSPVQFRFFFRLREPDLKTLGMTIHAALNLNQLKKDTPQSKSLQDLQVMWEGVDFLFIDEISMIGCSQTTAIEVVFNCAKCD